MSMVYAERPSFFNGQYLGAEDLEAFLRYAREQEARHLLGSHTWGIVAGIDLVAGTSPAGDVEYVLTPGVAIDGYGRLLVLPAPFPLTTDLFVHEPSGRVDVWIRHEETPFAGTRQGYGSCDCSDGFARVAESLVVEVGRRSPIDRQQSGVLLDQEAFPDPREALGSLLPGRPLACDGSVAAQAFPETGGRDLWLIPVGQVPWSGPPVSAFLPASEADRKASLMVRAVAGLVTGHIYPSSGLIRMRPRWTPRTSAGISQDCADHGIREADLVACQSGELSFREMIWLEGHSRFNGDVRLFGTRLEFQEQGGTDYLGALGQGVPVALRRRARPATARLAAGTDLEVLLGQRPNGGGPTRLSIGQATVQGSDPCAVDFDLKPGVLIQEDAKLGIGTDDSLLGLPLTIRALGDTGDLAGFQDASGNVAWQINFGTNKNGLNFTETNKDETRLFLASGGNVGIGTLTPEAKLDLRAVSTAGSSGLAAGKWLQVGDGGESGWLWLQYGPQLAPLLVLSGKDHPPRLQFQQLGSGQEGSPQFASWIGQARSNSSDLSLMGGNVGINTDQPRRRLHVEDSEMHSGGNFAGLSFSNRGSSFVETPSNGERWVWYGVNGAARLWSGSDKLMVTASGNVGINTQQPQRRLHVEDSEIHSGGNTAGFSFSNRGSTFVNVPSNGQRWVWYSAAGAARLWSGNDKLTINPSGNLGIGTSNPAERLDVRGNIKLGTNGNYFGVGCLDNVRMVAGRISSGGATLSGSGFFLQPTGVGGIYRIRFTIPFGSFPIVVATLVDAPDVDNSITVGSVSTNGFQVNVKDVAPPLEGAFESSAFNFIALGPRA